MHRPIVVKELRICCSLACCDDSVSQSVEYCYHLFECTSHQLVRCRAII